MLQGLSSSALANSAMKNTGTHLSQPASCPSTATKQAVPPAWNGWASSSSWHQVLGAGVLTAHSYLPAGECQPLHSCTQVRLKQTRLTLCINSPLRSGHFRPGQALGGQQGSIACCHVAAVHSGHHAGARHAVRALHCSIAAHALHEARG